jgi:hypothetical protein
MRRVGKSQQALEKQWADQRDFDDETAAQFRTRYAARVLKLCEELVPYGVGEDVLPWHWQHSISVYDLDGVAIKIGAIGEEL